VTAIEMDIFRTNSMRLRRLTKNCFKKWEAINYQPQQAKETNNANQKPPHVCLCSRSSITKMIPWRKYKLWWGGYCVEDSYAPAFQEGELFALSHTEKKHYCFSVE